LAQGREHRDRICRVRRGVATRAACATAGWRVRKKGLTLISNAMVEGSVGSPRERLCSHCCR
jgi:hypothetical protein